MGTEGPVSHQLRHRADAVLGRRHERNDAGWRRQADLYVFALLAHQDKATLDPMDVGQWVFFLLPTAVLNARLPLQKQLGLAGLRSLCPFERAFGQLREAIDDVAQAGPDLR